jgi:very-short-patch-repair endonuclease
VNPKGPNREERLAGLSAGGMSRDFARQLRKSSTDAAKRLWSKLRHKQVEGFRFRRQQPIGRYIVDFFCPEAKVIIEVDGGQHADAERSDLTRTMAAGAWLSRDQILEQ